MAAAAVTSSMAVGTTCRTATSAAAAAAVELDRVSWRGRAGVAWQTTGIVEKYMKYMKI
jgi:hypothetical protein